MPIEDIEKQVLEWHNATFPNATDKAICEKLYEEIGELGDEAWEYLHNRESNTPAEIADVAIVSIALLSRINTSLSAVIAAKLAVNKARDWGPETENGDRKRVK